jgi:hypothetical protein
MIAPHITSTNKAILLPVFFQIAREIPEIIITNVKGSNSSGGCEGIIPLLVVNEPV